MHIALFFFIILFHLYNLKNITSPNNHFFNYEEEIELDDNLELYCDVIQKNINLLFDRIYNEISSSLHEENDDDSTKCINFFYIVKGYSKKFINVIAKKMVRNGFESYSMDGENTCLENNELYALVTLNYSINSINNNLDDYSLQYQLFIETLIYEQEICIWNDCIVLYKMLEQIIDFIKNEFKNLTLFDDLKFEGMNLMINGTSYYESEHKENNIKSKYFKYFKYKLFLKIILYIVFIILIIGTIISICLDKDEDDDNKDDDNNQKRRKRDSNIIDSDEESGKTFFSRSSLYNDKRLYNFFSAFNIINNSLLISKKKEPLSNQNSLIELSTIRLIIIFFILLAENAEIIIKYIYKGRYALEFLTSLGFVFIKFGTECYEYYKIICGVIFGFKFINYYYKPGEFNLKKILKFIFKFIPYFIILLIINYIFQYHSAELVSILHGSVRNDYISKRMNNCYFCQQDYLNFLNPLMLRQYNSTDYNTGQYDGCFRTTLFTISEFYCYIFILMLMILFIKVKNKLLELIFFLLSLIILLFTYFITKETKDLKYFTVSRLFGLSASLAKPYLFFPLYFIGFNIGIIYYYNKHQAEIFNELNLDKEKKYIPFEYCYKLSLFLKMINGKTKNIILFICFLFIIGIASCYTYLINKKKNIYFEFDSFAKFIYVYEGILGGIIFSIFLAVYLSQDEENNVRLYLSSEIFIFMNKISFVLFNMFLSILRIFHGINILGIHLTTLNVIRNSFTLFIIILLISIIFIILIFIPIKWIFFFLMNGLNFEY